MKSSKSDKSARKVTILIFLPRKWSENDVKTVLGSLQGLRINLEQFTSTKNAQKSSKTDLSSIAGSFSEFRDFPGRIS